MINIDLVLVIGQSDENGNFHVNESISLEWHSWNSQFNKNLSLGKFSAECETVNQVFLSYDRKEYNVAQLRLEINGSLPLIICSYFKDGKDQWVVE